MDLNHLETQASPRVPHIGLTMLEPFRMAAEFGMLGLALPRLMTRRRGNGHAVLVLPGFVADDSATIVLRLYLTLLGYRAEGWSLGRNFGERILGADGARLRARVHDLFESSGRKISLIGWSLGGVMARRMAREHPDMIRQVISLGSPFTGDPAATAVRPLYEMLSGEHLSTEAAQRRFERDRVTPGVPSTSIFSRTDGITCWRNCLEEEGPLAENVEVGGSHSGMVFNGDVFAIIADRLAQPEGRWRAYRRPRAPG